MISTAFPEYDQTTLPAIPATWVDTSWRNDVCPSWIANEFHVFIERVGPEEREYPETERFSVCEIETGEGLLQSDNWQEILEFVK